VFESKHFLVLNKDGVKKSSSLSLSLTLLPQKQCGREEELSVQNLCLELLFLFLSRRRMLTDFLMDFSCWEERINKVFFQAKIPGFTKTCSFFVQVLNLRVL